MPRNHHPHAVFANNGADQIVARGIGLTCEQRDEFHGALATVEGRNQRLDDADGAVVSAGIAPGFEFMRLIDVPLTKFGGFVLIKTKMHAERDLAIFQDIRKIKIGGRFVRRIAA